MPKNISVADPDPVLFCPSIRDSNKFLGIKILQFCRNFLTFFSVTLPNHKIIQNFVKYMATKKGKTQFFPPSLFLNPGWKKSGIRNEKKNGSYRDLDSVNYVDPDPNGELESTEVVGSN
jgi:hypothetical protein